MTSEVLISAAAVLLSLLFSYVPGFADWYQPLPADKKRLLMLGFLVLVTVGSFGLACIGWEVIKGLACTNLGAFELVKLFVLAVIVNQATYAVSPQNTRQREVWEEKADARRELKPKVKNLKDK